MKLLIFSWRLSDHFLGGDGRTSALWVYFESMNVFSAIILPRGVKILRDQNFMLSSMSLPIVSKFWSVSDALHVKFIPSSLKFVSKDRGIVGSKGVGLQFFPMLMHTVFDRFTSSPEMSLKDFRLFRIVWMVVLSLGIIRVRSSA